MVVYPGSSPDHVRFRLVRFEEGSAILAEEDKLFVEEESVDPANLPRCAIVRNITSTTSPFSGVYGLAKVVENIKYLAEVGCAPAVWKHIRHAASASFNSCT